MSYQDISKDLIAGIFDLLDPFVLYRRDTITLAGTSGTANITCDGVTKTATWHTSLTITASDFVSTFAADYATGGVTVTSSGAVITFLSSVAGQDFTGATSISSLSLTLTGTKANTDITYPVYKNILKPPAETYIYIGQVNHTEDGDKDNFMYFGTVNVITVDESAQSGDKKLAQLIANRTREMLKATRTSVPACGSKTVVVFTPGPYNELSELSDTGASKIRLIDTYTFNIN